MRRSRRPEPGPYLKRIESREVAPQLIVVIDTTSQ